MGGEGDAHGEAIRSDGDDSPWAGMMDDLFESLLARLNCRQVAPLRSVCSRWRDKARRLLLRFETRPRHLRPMPQHMPASLPDLFPALNTIKMDFRGDARWRGSIACLSQLGRLRQLELSGGAVRPWGLPSMDLGPLSGCPCLSWLKLVRCRCTAGAGLQRLTQLQELTLSRCSIDAWDPGLVWILAPIRGLRHLRIDGYTDEARVNLVGVSSLQGLSSLVLRLPVKSPTETFEEIVGMVGISSLDVELTDCQAPETMYAVGLQCVTGMTNLRELRVTAQLALFPDRGVDGLATLVKLQVLHISSPSLLEEDLLEFPDIQHGRIMDADVQHLMQLQHLTSLGLSNSLVTANALSHVAARLTSLKSIDLSSCRNVNDAALFALSRLWSLTALNIAHCIQVTDRGLGALARSGLPLRVLDLAGCYTSVTDMALCQLSRLSVLEWLSVAYCEHISDMGLRNLVSGTSLLRFLSLRSCLNITDWGVEAICRNLLCLRELDIAYCCMVSERSTEGLSGLENLKPQGNWPSSGIRIDVKGSLTSLAINREFAEDRTRTRGLAGAVSRTATAPVDRLKMLLQVQDVSGPRPMVAAFRKMASEGTVKSYFRGNGTNVLKIAPETAIKLTTSDRIKMFIAYDVDDIQPPERFISGALAGAIAQLTVYPLEVLRTRLAVCQVGTYSGLTHAAASMYFQEGWKSFYRGLTPSLIGIVPYAGVDIAAFEILMEDLTEHYNGDPPAPMILGAGMLSSSFAQFVSYPLALAKTRLQADGTCGTTPKYNGLLDVIYKAIRNEGLRGLYKGLLPNMLKLAPAAGISWFVFEKTKQFFGVGGSP
eukprot:evm.model.scf_426.11 EVM.evm.TU.scf_426.11   scf_426:76755-83101(-)